ncbi:cell wall-associated NlpC family hydrolase [Paenibacillus sp. V4I9]|uniref:C40 family peptidase n=1 Tax=Paenibacillus sp. V4I9 TaxID=3042308 RepID=UPI002781D2BC|nr:C40 family peptidase [Paenibacillus sp. V4I9]MDQ0891009.1 cell wall-associated NlpC family hydrolase [Paenibacillus sp. V4I9]
MLAKKYAIAALVFAFLVLIGFTIKNPENMELSAAFSNAHSNRWVAAAPIQLSGQDTTTDKESSAKPKAEVRMSEQGSAPFTGSEVQLTTPDSSVPFAKENENALTQDQTHDGDDPVPNAKNVKISAAEIAKVVAHFERLAHSDQKEPSWKRKADHLVVKGFGFLGTPYVFGAKSDQTDSFDCSSFLRYIFISQGVSLPRDSRQQSQLGTEVSIDQLREGDLVFFTTPKRKNKSGIDRIGHVAVYLGNGLMLHTFRPGIGVTISELNSSWRERLVKAKRVL